MRFGVAVKWDSAEAKVYLRFALKPRRQPATKFVVFSSGRSGSSLLVNLLGSHPGICCEDEILHHRVLFPGLYVRCRSAVFGTSVYGFKLLSYQIKSVQKLRDPRRFMVGLHRSGYHLIYLRRRNTLRLALSNIYARRRGTFHHRAQSGTFERTRMHVSVEELTTWLEGLERAREFEEQVLEGLPRLEFTYEDDLEDSRCHQATADRAAAYLGISAAPVIADFVRLTSPDLASFVANSEEIEEFVRNTRYRVFLDPPAEAEPPCDFSS